MNIQKLILSDIRKDGVHEEIQATLRRVKPLKRYADIEEDIPFEVLEKVFVKIQEKYNIRMQYIMVRAGEDESPSSYTLSMKEMKTHQWVGTVYGLTMYELFAKAILLSVAYVKKRG